jgi:hypothetical protein
VRSGRVSAVLIRHILPLRVVVDASKQTQAITVLIALPTLGYQTNSKFMDCWGFSIQNDLNVVTCQYKSSRHLKYPQSHNISR